MSPTFGEHFTSELPRTPCLRTSENLPSRDCLKIPNGPHRGLLREVGTGLKALFRRLECHQTHALKRPLAIFQTVSPRTRVIKPEIKAGLWRRRYLWTSSCTVRTDRSSSRMSWPCGDSLSRSSFACLSPTAPLHTTWAQQLRLLAPCNEALSSSQPLD